MNLSYFGTETEHSPIKPSRKASLPSVKERSLRLTQILIDVILVIPLSFVSLWFAIRFLMEVPFFIVLLVSEWKSMMRAERALRAETRKRSLEYENYP